METLKENSKKIELTAKQENKFKNLKVQIDKIAKHVRKGSFQTRERYHDSILVFCKFLAKDFGTEKFSNISDKHVAAYVADMQTRGLSASTVKTNLSAIRYYHDQINVPRFELSGNDKYDLEKRVLYGCERAWTQQEYNKFQEVCKEMNNTRVLQVSMLARNEGLRIHETLKIDRNAVEKAISTGMLHVKGKGGKERDVPLSKESREMLEEQIKKVNRGEKVFLKNWEKTHLIIKQIQNFINFHRSKFADENNEYNRTFHGIRHSYAREQYEQRIQHGKTELQARLEVSRLLGHERDEVTKIYLT